MPDDETAKGNRSEAEAVSVWQSRPLFIASTFLDFHAERDHLRNIVFRELEERLRKRRCYVEPIDLRWGVETTSESEVQSKEMTVLKVCLAEVERSRPFLIGLVGDRYGWVPPEERMLAAAQEAGFEGDLTGRSVTDLEIDFGVLQHPGQQQRCFFYFRERLPYDEMPPKVAARYSELHGPEGEAGHERLVRFRNRIEEAVPERVRRYTAQWDANAGRVTNLDAWGQQVLEDLWAELDPESRTRERQAPSRWQDQERFLLEQFIEDRSRNFSGRDAIVGELTRQATSPELIDEIWGATVTGDAGAGKSALFAALHRRLNTEDVVLLAHAAGVTPAAGRVDRMLRRWIDEMAAALAVDPAIPDNATAEDIEGMFHSLLGRLSVHCRVVLLIDALNQFEPTTQARHLTWLPRLWPENARMIATAIPGVQSAAFSQRPGTRLLELAPLSRTEAAEIAREICARYHRQLNAEVLGALIRKEASGSFGAGNPLWLTMAVEELNLLDTDDFERAERHFTGTPEEKLYQLLLTTVHEMSPTVEGLYGQVFDRAESLHGAAFVQAVVNLIAVSRSGFREQDFAALIPELTQQAWEPLRFAALRRTLRTHIVQKGSQGQWDAVHTQMREAVTRRNLSEADLKRILQIRVRSASAAPDKGWLAAPA